MSTILKTLKKLEEEKSYLDQDLNLKELVLRGETTPLPSPQASSRTLWWVVGLVLGVLVLAGTFYLVFSPSSEPETTALETAPAPDTTSLSSSPVEKIPAPRFQSHMGVPLANIPEEDIPLPEPAMDRDLFEVVEIPAASEPPVETEEVSALPEEVREIRSLIESATVSAQRLDGSPETEVTANRRIPIDGLRIKGIIYLGPDNPANHILISTPSQNHLKMKVGDSTQEAALQSIHPSKAVFMYRGEAVDLGIGE